MKYEIDIITRDLVDYDSNEGNKVPILFTVHYSNMNYQTLFKVLDDELELTLDTPDKDGIMKELSRCVDQDMAVMIYNHAVDNNRLANEIKADLDNRNDFDTSLTISYPVKSIDKKNNMTLQITIIKE